MDGRLGRSLDRPDSTLLSVLPFMDNSVCDGADLAEQCTSQAVPINHTPPILSLHPASFEGADAVLPCLERRRRPTHLCLELAVHSFKQRARNTRMAGDSARGVEWSCAPDQDAKRSSHKGRGPQWLVGPPISRSSHKGRGPQWLVGPPISPMKVTFDSMSYV